MHHSGHHSHALLRVSPPALVVHECNVTTIAINMRAWRSVIAPSLVVFSVSMPYDTAMHHR